MLLVFVTYITRKCKLVPVSKHGCTANMLLLLFGTTSQLAVGHAEAVMILLTRCDTKSSPIQLSLRYLLSAVCQAERLVGPQVGPDSGIAGAQPTANPSFELPTSMLRPLNC